jgi:FixJ family two-component response regulator
MYEPGVAPVTLVVTADLVLGGCLAWLLRAGGLDAQHSDLPVELLEPEPAVTGVVVDGRLLEPSPTHVLARLRTTFPDAVVVAMAGRPDHPGLRAAVDRGAVPLTADFELTALVQALGGDAPGDGGTGVREPRRPYPPTFPGVLALDRPGRH